MPLSLVMVKPPTQEPIRLDEAKLHMRVDLADDDTLILGYIQAARQYLETVTRRTFLTTIWQLSVDDFSCWDAGYSTRWGRSTAHGWLALPRPPLVALSGTYTDSAGDPQPLGITYQDSNGVTQTLATSVYGVDAASEPGRVYLAPAQSWPSVYGIPNAVQVTYQAGYATAARLFQERASLRWLLLLMVAHMYENREISAEKALTLIPNYQDMLWINKLVEVG